ncbi:MAG: hypothetical protein ACRDTA_10055 [Pseudonocardiaceae bacterium]
MIVTKWTGVEVFALRDQALRMTQEDLREKTGYSVSVISKWERAGPNIVLKGRAAEAMDTLLKGLDPDQADRFRAVVIEGRRPDPGHPTSVVAAAGDQLALEGVETSHRRHVIALAAAVMFGAPLGRSADVIIEAADRRKVPSTVRLGDVRQLRDTAETLASLDRKSGGGSTRNLLLGELRWGQALLDGSCGPGVREPLAAIIADLADGAAWATFDAGLEQEARDLFMLGFKAAHESKDLGMRAHVATGFARLEVHAGDTEAALDLLQLAQTASDVLTPNGLAMLHTTKALAYGRAGDVANCRRHITLAEDGYRSDTAAGDPTWLHYFTPAKLSGDAAAALYKLTIARSALNTPRNSSKTVDRQRESLIRQLANAVALYPDTRARSKAIAAAQLATLRYLEDDLDGANSAARTALDLGEGVRSARLGADLRLMARVCTLQPNNLARALGAEAKTLASVIV